MTHSGPWNAAQVASSAYRVAALDQEFLLDDSTRGLRFQLERHKAAEARAADSAEAWSASKAAGIAAAGGRVSPAEDAAGNLPLG